MVSQRWKVSTDCIHMAIMPSPPFRAANIGSIVRRKEPAQRVGEDHVFCCMARVSGQQKPFCFPLAIDEHRYPNGSDKTTAEEAGHADSGAMANGALAAVDRQFRVRWRQHLELLLGDPVAVLAGPSWFSRPQWRRLIQGGVASDLSDDDGVAYKGDR